MHAEGMRARLLLLTLVAACGSDGPPPNCDTEEEAEACLAASCAGRVVNNCLPYEYSIVRSASWAPESIGVDDPGARFRYRIELDRCEEAPMRHDVRLEFLRPPERVLDLLPTPIRIDDTTPDDPAGPPQPRVARKVAEAEIGNPFFGPEIPESRSIEIRVESRAGAQLGDAGVLGGTCVGRTLLTTYRTGEGSRAGGPELAAARLPAAHASARCCGGALAASSSSSGASPRRRAMPTKVSKTPMTM